MSLKQKIAEFFLQYLPVQRRTVYNGLSAIPSLASQLDVDGIHAIFRDAEAGDVTRLFALYRDILIADSHLQTEFGKRLLAVMGKPLAVQPKDKEKQEDVAAAAEVLTMTEVRGWLQACAHLLAGTLWPVAVVEKVYAVDPCTGRYRLQALVPVPYDLLDYSNGRLMIRATNEAGQPSGPLLEADESRYIIHRGHLLPTPDYWGGPFRSLVFWWFFGAMDRSSWARFIERYGAPFLVGKYDSGDVDSRSVLERAFSNAAQLFGIAITRETEVEIQQAASAPAGEAFELLHATCNKEKSKLILGQTMSSEAQSTGIGQGASPQHETVRQDIRQFDASQLATTLRDQLVTQFCRINGIAGQVKLVFGGESGDQAEATGKLLASLTQAGLQVTDEGLPVVAERLGLSIERVKASAPALPGLAAGLLPLASEALGRQVLDRMSSGGTASLARRFRASSAPLRELIEAAQSPEEVVAGVRALSLGWDDGQTADLLTQALVSYAANGSVVAESA